MHEIFSNATNKQRREPNTFRKFENRKNLSRTIYNAFFKLYAEAFIFARHQNNAIIVLFDFNKFFSEQGLLLSFLSYLCKDLLHKLKNVDLDKSI